MGQHMEPLSAFSAAKKLATVGKIALSLSQKESLLSAFQVESDGHSLLMLEMLAGALRQHDLEQEKKTGWYEATVDESMPVAARQEALAGLRETFLRLLRTSHDPVLGNKMLAAATAGLAQFDYPEEIQARVLRIVTQLVPADVDLLVRYVTQGIARWEPTDEDDSDAVVYTRHLVQEDYVLRFVLSDGTLSDPLDSFAYNALKQFHLISDYVLPEPGPTKRPTHYPGGPPRPAHEPFRLEWRFNIFSKMIVEAFTGYSLRQILEAEIGPPGPTTGDGTC